MKFLEKIKGFQIALYALAFLCIISAIEAFFQNNNQSTTNLVEEPENTSSYNYTPTEESSQELEEVVNKSTIYTVKEYEGIIGVFENEDTLPCMTAPSKVSDLPDEDKAILSSGVCFTSYKELIKFLEDYE